MGGLSGSHRLGRSRYFGQQKDPYVELGHRGKTTLGWFWD
jgi:hypothetical protein